MSADTELLRRYVDEQSETAFAELVGKYLDLIYQAAMRRAGGRSDLAADIAQEVFIQLARRAPKLIDHPVLAGWLYTTCRHVAHDQLRAERRRQIRQQEAQMRDDLASSPTPPPEWDQLHGELDRVMDQLPTQDREAILLRFFHGQAFAQIGATFGLSDEAARKRVDRALDRLRQGLVKRGITSTAAALGALLSSHAVSAAPIGLSQTVTVAAIAHAASGALPTAGLIQFMGTKLTVNTAAALGLAALLGISSLGVAVYQQREAQRATSDLNEAAKALLADRARIQEMDRQTQEADQHVVVLQGEIEKARTALAAKSAVPASPSAAAAKANANAPLTPEEIADFFSRYGQARGMIMELGKAQVTTTMMPFFRSTQLTDEQKSELINRTAQFWLDHISITPNNVTPSAGQLPDAELKEILGEENFQRFQNYHQIAPAYGVTLMVALSVGYTAQPLSDAQSQQLVQLVAASGNAGQPGAKLDMKNIDWNTVMSQAPNALTPEQFQAAQPVLLSLQYNQALQRAQAAASAAAAHPKS